MCVVLCLVQMCMCVFERTYTLYFINYIDNCLIFIIDSCC